jgi:hypothetical protein
MAERASLGAAPTRQPAKERPERESGLGCEGEIGGDADEDAERQAQHGSDRDADSDSDARECMAAATQAGSLALEGDPDGSPEGELAERKLKQRPVQPLDDAELQKVGV